MASNSFTASPPIFIGENYQLWAVKIQSYLQAFDLWEVVESDKEVVTPLPANPTVAQLKSHSEEKAKKFKVKTCIFSSVSKTIFNSIMSCETPKEIWDLLKSENLRNTQARLMQVLNMKREFEIQKMKEEGIKEYVNKFMTIVNKIRLFGETFSDNRIVEKIIVSLLEKYESKISSLEDSKDLSKITVVELVNALQATEQRRAFRDEKTMEEAFVAKTGKVQFPKCGTKINKNRCQPHNPMLSLYNTNPNIDALLCELGLHKISLARNGRKHRAKMVAAAAKTSSQLLFSSSHSYSRLSPYQLCLFDSQTFVSYLSNVVKREKNGY